MKKFLITAGMVAMVAYASQGVFAKEGNSASNKSQPKIANTVKAKVVASPKTATVSAGTTATSSGDFRKWGLKPVVESSKAGELKDKQAAQKLELQTKRIAKIKELASKHGDQLERHFGFYRERLGRLISKMQSRIDKVKLAGVDVSKPQAKLDEASAKLIEANKLAADAVNAFKGVVGGATSADDLKFKAMAARDIAVSAREAYVKTSELTKEAFNLLKPIAKEAKTGSPKPSSSPVVSPTPTAAPTAAPSPTIVPTPTANPSPTAI
jgi:Spy/CpxP family protein refolding chaperone